MLQVAVLLRMGTAQRSSYISGWGWFHIDRY